MAGFDDREGSRGADDWDGPPPVDRDKALKAVGAPATALIVVAILTILTQLVVIGLVFAAPNFVPFFEKLADDPKNAAQREPFLDFVEKLKDARSPVNFIAPFLGIVVGGVMLLGALKMRRLESFGLSMTASILALNPAYPISCCCVVGIPVGIWALVILLSSDVKAAFR